jgi:hypothetical protein
MIAGKRADGGIETCVSAPALLAVTLYGGGRDIIGGRICAGVEFHGAALHVLALSNDSRLTYEHDQITIYRA